MVEIPHGVADADAALGRPFPLPTVVLPLARWVDVSPLGTGAEVVWNLDDTRPGTPARLALYAGPAPAPEREIPGGEELPPVEVGASPARLVVAELEDAEPSLRPVHELTWEAAGLQLRLTAQGPWTVAELLRIAASVAV